MQSSSFSAYSNYMPLHATLAYQDLIKDPKRYEPICHENVAGRVLTLVYPLKSNWVQPPQWLTYSERNKAPQSRFTLMRKKGHFINFET